MDRRNHNETQGDDLLMGTLEYMKEETIDGVVLSEEQTNDVLEGVVKGVADPDSLEEDIKDDEDILEGGKRRYIR